MVPLDGGKSQRSRGGGGRAPRAQSMGGALGPAHALVLRDWGALGPPRPAKRRRPPRRTPTATRSPHISAPPAALQRSPGGAGRMGRAHAGAAAQRGFAPLRARCRAPPGSGRVGFAHPPPRRPPQRQPAPPTSALLRRPYSGGSVAPRKAPAFQRGAAAFGSRGQPRSFRALRAPPPQFAKVVGRGRQGGFLQLPCSLGFRLAFSATGGARLPQFAKVVGRGRQGGFLQLPCALGFRLAVSATGGARLPQFAKVVARRRQGGFLQLPCALGFRLAVSATGGARLPQFAKVVVRRRQGGFLQLPCSLGFRLASSATGGARLRPPSAGFSTNAKKTQRNVSHKPSAPLPMSGAPA